MASNRPPQGKAEALDNLSSLSEQELDKIIRYVYEKTLVGGGNAAEAKEVLDWLILGKSHEEIGLSQNYQLQSKDDFEEFKKYLQIELRKIFPSSAAGEECAALKQFAFSYSEEEIQKIRKLKTIEAMLDFIKTAEAKKLILIQSIDTTGNFACRILTGLIKNAISNRYDNYESCLRLILGIAIRAQRKVKNETQVYTAAHTSQYKLKRILQGKREIYLKTIEEPQRSGARKVMIHLPRKTMHTGREYILDRIIETINESSLFDVCEPLSSEQQSDCISTEEVKKIINNSHKNLDDYYVFDFDELFNLNDKFNNNRIMEISTEDINQNTLKVLKNVKSLVLKIPVSRLFNSLGEISWFVDLMNSLEHLETLTIFSDNATFSRIEFKKKYDNIRNLYLKFGHGEFINLDNAPNIENIYFDGVCLYHPLDLSNLNQLKYVKFKFSEFSKLIINELQISSVIFDFSDDFRFNQNKIKEIIRLRSAGARIILNDDVELKVANHLLDKKDDFNPIEASRPTLSSRPCLTPPVERYDNAASPMQKTLLSERPTLDQTASLLNENGAIPPSEYRQKILTGIEAQYDGLYFTPYLVDEHQLTPVDLSEIKKIDKNEFTKTKAAELSRENVGSFLGRITLSTDHDQWIPLKGRSLEDKLVLLDNDSLELLDRNHIKLDLGYAKETRQYFARLKKTELSPKDAPRVIDFNYGMSPTLTQNELVSELAVKVLPPDLRAAITHLQDKNPELKKIFEAKTDEARINALIDYCALYNVSDLSLSFDQVLNSQLLEEARKNSRPMLIINEESIVIYGQDEHQHWKATTFRLSQLLAFEREYIEKLRFNKSNRVLNKADYYKTPLSSILMKGHEFHDRDCSKDGQEIAKTLSELSISNAGIHEVMTQLCTQSGSCHHRSRAFMALSNYFNIPARVNVNEVHEFVEYFSGERWHLCNQLGGRRTDLQTYDPWEKPANLSENKQNFNELVQKNEEIKTDEEIKPDDEFDSCFELEEKVLDEKQGFQGWYRALCQLTDPPPLLEYKNLNDPLNLHSLIMDTPGYILGENYFYIEDPDDFERYLTPLQVFNNDCDAVEGPLLRLLNDENSQGTIFINWARFSTEQIATYKCILGEFSTLNGRRLPKGIKMINASLADSDACSAFHTRVQDVAWPINPNTIAEQAPRIQINSYHQNQQAPETVIDLYNSPNWEAFLVGEPKITEKGFTYKPGALLKAIEENQAAIHLTGLPVDVDSYNLFFERIQREKGFYANGVWKTIPNHFRFHLYPDPIAEERDLPVYEPRNFADKEAQPVFFINRQNYHEFFERITIDAQQKPQPLKGLLKTLPADSILVITDELSEGQRRQLGKKIKKLGQLEKPRNIHLQTLPYLIEREAKTQPPIPLEGPIEATAVVLTEDVEAAARLIEQAEKPKHSIHISNKTEFSDLFDNTELIRDEVKSENELGKRTITCTHEYFELYEALKNGETVLLKGDISSELYHQMETLFAAPPYLMVNGERVEIPGKLILVTPEKKDYPNLFAAAGQHYQHQFSWDRIPAYLMSELKIELEEGQDLAKRIENFHEAAAKIKHNGITTPPAWFLPEELVLAIAWEMKRGSANPIKHILQQNYTEDKDSYDKLTELSRKYLLTRDLEEKKPFASIEPLDMQKRKLIDAILQDSPFIELRGTPGTGKTYFIENNLKDDKPYLGEEKIIEWLKSFDSIEDPSDPDSQKIKYLLIDEANMKEPGYWDFLKGLKTGVICYKGILYPVNPKFQKVFLTGNPENYPGRHFHSFLRQVPKVYFESYTDQYLSEKIIFPRLNQSILDQATQSDIARRFIFAYKHTKEQLPYEFLSIRDIKSLLDHLFYPNTPGDAETAKARAHLACIEVFSGLFKDAGSRAQFLAALQHNFMTASAELLPLPKPSDDYILPEASRLLWNNVNRCIDRGGLLPQGARRGVLVEGPSGLGKTKMMVEALEAKDFINIKSYDPKNPAHQKVYYHLTLGTENITELILEARALSAKMPVAIVMDELNLLKQKDEALLTPLLEGREPDLVGSVKEENKDKDANPHYNLIFLTSQNSQLESGRKLLSHPFLNRFDRVYEVPYTKQDLLEICAKSRKFKPDLNDPRANRFVDRYLRQEKRNPKKINCRRFFRQLKNLKPLPSLPPALQTRTASQAQSAPQTATSPPPLATTLPVTPTRPTLRAAPFQPVTLLRSDSNYALFAASTSSEPLLDKKHSPALTEFKRNPGENPEITRRFKDFDRYLIVIYKKHKAMKGQDAITVAKSEALHTLYTSLVKARNEVTSLTKESLSLFETTCSDATAIAKASILKDKRDPSGWKWKQFFSGLKGVILSVLTLGGMNYYKKAWPLSLYPPKTDSIQKIETIEKKIAALMKKK